MRAVHRARDDGDAYDGPVTAEAGRRGEGWRGVPVAERWLGRADRLPRWAEAESVVLADVIGGRTGARVLDLGSGDGHMLQALRKAGSCAEGVGIDFSQPLLEAAARRFDGDPTVRLIEHDLAKPLPRGLGAFEYRSLFWAPSRM